MDTKDYVFTISYSVIFGSIFVAMVVFFARKIYDHKKAKRIIESDPEIIGVKNFKFK